MDLNNEESGMLILRMAHFLNLIPCVTDLCLLCTLSHFILTMLLWDRYYYYPYFTCKGAEVESYPSVHTK